MIYVDSDGTISDFLGWALEKDPKALDSPDSTLHWERVSELMVLYYKEVFLVSKPLGFADFFIEEIKNNDDWFVLTALSEPNRLEKYCKNVDVQEVLDTHRENKYLWFEKRGIPREKVIICDSSKDKTKYCKDFNDLLYDDNWDNIKAWRAAGGSTIKVGNKYVD